GLAVPPAERWRTRRTGRLVRRPPAPGPLHGCELRLQRPLPVDNGQRWSTFGGPVTAQTAQGQPHDRDLRATPPPPECAGQAVNVCVYQPARASIRRSFLARVRHAFGKTRVAHVPRPARLPFIAWHPLARPSDCWQSPAVPK